MMYNTDTYTGPSFSVKNRIGRAIWSIAAVLFFRFTPNAFHPWRSFILRCFGARVGRGVHVYPNTKIWAPWNLVLGDECGIADDVILYSQGKIQVGYRAIVSQGTNLCTGTHDYTRAGHPLIIKPINIGDYAWLAAGVFVHPGVVIGDGCVVGARSVVTKSIPKWTVCAGNPCKYIKNRTLEKL